MRFTSVVLVMALAAACGDDDDDTPIPDAAAMPDGMTTPDAGSPDATPPCPTCDYAPEPLTAGEIPIAEQQALAERFNPAHVFTHPVRRNVTLDYVLQEGGPLMQAPILQPGPYWMRLDLAMATPVDPAPDLLNDDWSTLPLMDGMGNALAYFIDVPGDNTGPGYDEETWSAEWTAHNGPSYPITQYAHLFWLSRADGFLAIQYWFWSPWNKYLNNHEGDWEHVNVIVERPAGGDWAIVMAHYSFHARQAGLLVDDLVRVADRDGGDGDHVVVFTGGDACGTLGTASSWCGSASGPSFPYPGLYPTSADELAGGGTSLPGYPLHANDIEVVVLPRPDEPVAPNLSWYKLPFFAGHPETAVNAAASIATNAHRAPLAPNPWHFEFEEAIPAPYDVFTEATPEPFAPPMDWTMIANPSSSF